MSLKIHTLKGNIKVVTGLHIGAGNDEIHIGGIDSCVIKDKDGFPYIPGSSLKGKIRALLELSDGLYLKKGEPSTTTDNPESLIPKVFGDTSGTNLTRILFRDAFLTKEDKEMLIRDKIVPTESKSENSIDRISGTAENPRNIERVIPGLSFAFEIVLRELEGDDIKAFKELIQKGIDLLEKDALGGNGSRGYGKVIFEDLSWD